MRIKWNLKAFEEIRRAPGVGDRLQTEVDRVLDQLPDGYEGGVEPGKTRTRGYVVTASPEAMRHESETHAMLRGLG